MKKYYFILWFEKLFRLCCDRRCFLRVFVPSQVVFIRALEEEYWVRRMDIFFFYLIALKKCWSCFGSPPQEMLKRNVCLHFFFFILLRVAVTDRALLILFSRHIFSNFWFFEVFRIFFINMFVLYSPGSRCNWSSSMTFCMYFV